MVHGRAPAPQAEAEADLYFGPFRLEGAKRLWRGDHLVELRPQPLVVLRYLAERPGRLMTGAELLKRLWPGIYVTKTVLRVCVREIRRALQEEPTTPQFIETVGRQGYRFIAPIATPPPVPSSQLLVASTDTTGEKIPQLATGNWLLTTHSRQLATPFVGREQELSFLHGALERVKQGERQVVFLLGEAGIGKTTLIDHFLDQILQGARDWRLETGSQRLETRDWRLVPPPSQASSLKPQASSSKSPAPSLRIGRGQCREHHGSEEAYLPMLEALELLCQKPGGEQVLSVLRRYAPLWLAQLPAVVKAGEIEELRRQVQGYSQKQMLRQLTEAVDALAADAVVVLVFEDLQWSDTATLEVVAYLAQRRWPARLYILGTYRPAEVVVKGHPLRRVIQELYGRRQCEELALELLTEAEVEEYLARGFGCSAAVSALSKTIYNYTDGNALFVVNFVDYLLQRKLLIAVDGQWKVRAESTVLKDLVPETLQQLITWQIERLTLEEQHLLEVASVSGRTFSAVEVAKVMGRALEEVEEVYDALASTGQFIAGAGVMEWPDGTVTVRYKFRHALYQQVLSEQLGPGRRMRLHRQIGERKELGYGEQAGEIAGELAVHFMKGRDYRRAVRYHCQAGETALQRHAYQEAADHCQEGLDLLEQMPDTLERQQQELALQLLFSTVLTATGGFGAEGLVQNLSRARVLC